MPRGVTHFQKDWLKEKDEKDHILSLWCRQGTVDAALCIFCNKISNKITSSSTVNPTVKRGKT